MDNFKGRVTLVSATWSAAHHAPNWLFCRGAQSCHSPTGGSGNSIPPRRQLRDRRNGRRRDRRDAAVSARRSSSILHALPPGVRGASGAYCVSTARFFVLEPPWRNPSQIKAEAILAPAKRAAEVAETRPNRNPCARLRTLELSQDRKGAIGRFSRRFSRLDKLNPGLARIGGQ